MEIGFIGLGRMGGNMAQRLQEKGHMVYGSDPSAAVRDYVGQNGVDATDTVAHLATKFTERPRIFWAMVPSGKITDSVLAEIAAVAEPGDIIIDGGNSNYKDSQRHYAEMEMKGLHFLDAGTSGGVWGLKNGYCLMIGGKKEVYDHVEPIFRDLACEDGTLYAGPAGAGHFTKMVHNGIEYAMLQGYAEGFELMHAATEFHLDLGAIAHLWNHGSVVRSWLLELAERAYAEEGVEFTDIRGWVEDSGEGRWTVEESVDRAVPLPAISLALQMRFRSRQEDSYAAKLIASLRNQFGGHALTAVQKEVTGTPQPSGGHRDL